MLKQDLTLQSYELEFNSIKILLTKLKNKKIIGLMKDELGGKMRKQEQKLIAT